MGQVCGEPDRAEPTGGKWKAPNRAERTGSFHVHKGQQSHYVSGTWDRCVGSQIGPNQRAANGKRPIEPNVPLASTSIKGNRATMFRVHGTGVWGARSGRTNGRQMESAQSSRTYR